MIPRSAAAGYFLVDFRWYHSYYCTANTARLFFIQLWL